MILDLSVQEYKRRVKENSAWFKDTHKASFDIGQYHGADLVRGERSPVAMGNKVYDFMAAAALGQLAFGRLNFGADGVKLVGGKRSTKLVDGALVEVEYKFTVINMLDMEVGKQGGISRKGCKTHCSLDASATAHWVINSDKHLETKNRITYLIVYDEYLREFIGAWEMDGDTVYRQLGSDSKKASKRRQLNWSVFRRLGTQVKLTVPSIGFAEYEDLIRKHYDWKPYQPTNKSYLKRKTKRLALAQASV
jgi:hypothetical protein